MNRVVITGMDVKGPLGVTLDQYSAGLQCGVSGATRLPQFIGREIEIGCPVRGLNLDNGMKIFSDYDPAAALRAPGILSKYPTKHIKYLSRANMFGMLSALGAYENAGLKSHQVDPDRIGVYAGTGMGGGSDLEDERAKLEKMVVREMAKGDLSEEEQLATIRRAAGKVSSRLVSHRAMINGVAALVGYELDVHGDCETIPLACASFNGAARNGYKAISNGEYDLALIVGAESTFAEAAWAGFTNMQAMTKNYNDDPTHASRPGDLNRDGFVMAEGGASIILESLDHALERGANILAEVIGYGSNTDSHDMTAPLQERQVQCMQKAIAHAGLTPEQIDRINGHMTSTTLNDITEAQAIRDVFGEYADTLTVGATKSMVGHGLGVAGGLEMIAELLGFRDNFIHGTINLDTPDPECNLNYLSEGTIFGKRANNVMLNSFGFGGHNVVLIIRRWTDEMTLAYESHQAIS